jgi:hypothetical protein
LFEGGYLETYDPATGACADGGFVSPYGEWILPTATLLSEGRVLFTGGEPVYTLANSTNTAVLYDPNGGPGRTGSTLATRVSQTATLLPDGSVLIAGGEDASGKPLASAELFTP